MKRIKFILIIIVAFMIFTSATINASAESTTVSDINNACEKVLYNLVLAENNQNWDMFCNLFTKDQTGELKEYFQSDKESGVKSVKSAKLVEVQFLDSKTNITEATSDLRNYIIGVDYNIAQEDKYYISGVNYHLITLKLENNEWKVLDYQDAPLENFISDNKSNNETRAGEIVKILPNLNPQNVKIMLDVFDARALGIIINAKGEFLGSNNENVKTAEDAKKTLEMIESGITPKAPGSQSRPAYITIYTIDETGIGDLNEVFLVYCEDVLPNEWYSSWPAESLKAGAMVIMQYSAYHVLHPRHTSVGCDVCDSTHCQVYRIASRVTSCNNAVMAVKDYYYETTGGTFFETCYAAGAYSSAYGHSGRMRQNGSHYWADNGKTWTWMMDYYYSDSNYNIPITDIVRRLWYP